MYRFERCFHQRRVWKHNLHSGSDFNPQRNNVTFIVIWHFFILIWHFGRFVGLDFENVKFRFRRQLLTACFCVSLSLPVRSTWTRSSTPTNPPGTTFINSTPAPADRLTPSASIVVLTLDWILLIQYLLLHLKWHIFIDFIGFVHWWQKRESLFLVQIVPCTLFSLIYPVTVVDS